MSLRDALSDTVADEDKAAKLYGVVVGLITKTLKIWEELR